MLTESTPFTIEHKINGERKIESKFIGHVNIKPGYFMYSYQPSDNKMAKVTITTSSLEQGKIAKYKKGHGHLIHPTHVDLIRHKAFHDPAKMYCLAINDKNAARKFAKIMYEINKL